MAFNVACRFQSSRSLAVHPHGSGIKLSIGYDDSKLGLRQVSVFLTHDDMLALTRELVDIENEYDTPLSFEDRPRNKPAEHLESVLSDLELAIREARKRLITG